MTLRDRDCDCVTEREAVCRRDAEAATEGDCDVERVVVAGIDAVDDSERVTEVLRE